MLPLRIPETDIGIDIKHYSYEGLMYYVQMHVYIDIFT